MGLYINGKLVGISLPQSGGGQPINNQDITVTENGIYEAEEGYTGLGEVTVNVPTPDTWYNWKNTIYTRDFTVVGSPVINDTTKTISGFSQSNYITFENIDTETANSFEICVKVSDYSPNSSTLLAMFPQGFGLFLQFIPYFGGSQLQVRALGETPLSDALFGITPITANSFYAKFSFTGSQYRLEYSSDGISWNLEDSETTSQKFENGSGTSSLGGASVWEDYTTLSLDLANTYINVNGTRFWTPYSESSSQCYTLTASPTTSTQVYEIPKRTSALTITSVGTGTITLSDSKVYNRNSAGDVQSPVLGTKTITSNDTYTAASDYLDGFSSVTVDVLGIPREVSAQGVLQVSSLQNFSMPNNITAIGLVGFESAFTESTSLVSADLSSIKTVDNSGLYTSFTKCINLTSVDLSGLTNIIGPYAFYRTFDDCTSLTNIDLSSLTTVSGDYSLYNGFRNCTALTSLDLSSLATVSGSYGLASAFNGCTSLTNVDLSSLTTVSGSSGLLNAFSGCTSLTSVDLSSLTTVSGSSGLASAFNGCTSLTNVDLSALTTVSGNNGLTSAFYGCTSLASVDLSALTTVSGSGGLVSAFNGCTGLTDIYFRALTTTSFVGSYKNQFLNMLLNTGTTTTHTLHFPSNLQTTISGLTGYPLFGGTSGYVTCLFDLPATE